ncbi:MAG: OmpA family protein [bacterium]
MKKLTLIVLALLFILNLSAAPSLYTSSGLLHSVGAIIQEQRLQLGFHINGFTRDFMVDYVSVIDDSTYHSWDTYAGGGIQFGIGYSFTNWLEVSVVSEGFIDAIDTPEAPGRADENTNYASYGFGDTEVNLKLTTGGLFGATKNADIGVLGFYRFTTGDLYTPGQSNASSFSIDYIKNDGGIFRKFTTNGADWGVRGLISFVTSSQVPLGINLNGGYTKLVNMPAGNNPTLIDFAGGLSIKFGSFIPFIEVYGFKYNASRMFDARYVYYMSGGVRFDTPIGLVIDFGADYRIPKFLPDLEPIHNSVNDTFLLSDGWGGAPDWKAYFGLTYYYDFKKEEIIVKKEEPKTIITGKVINGETGVPMSAIITFPGYSDSVSIVSDSLGIYSITVNPGTIRIRAEREGFKWQEKGVIIEKAQTKIVDFALNPKKVEKGIITGKVSDKASGETLLAKISFPQTGIPEILPDAATGVYRITLDPGTYTIAAVAEGYISYAMPVVVEADKTLILNIEMLKKGGKITLRGIYFESGKATILPESFYALDEAVKLLNDNPKVRIEIQGHTDSVGSDSSNLSLSQARAESVRNYLVSHGIDPMRVVAKGFGEMMPVADNGTKDGRALNRRIEFLILGE